jgi:predicted PurR-regulated permease PerM
MYQPNPAIDPPLRFAIFLIATILTFGALKLGADILSPLVLALVTGVILAPLTDFLRRLGMPITVAALAILSFGLLLLMAVVFLAEPLIWKVVGELPKLKDEVRNIVEEFRTIIQGIDEVNKGVEEVLGTDGADSTGTAKAEGGDSAVPSLTDALFFAPVLVAHFLIFSGSLFFFLLTRNGIYNWLSHFIARDDPTVIRERLHTAEHLVSRYFVTISIINAGLGLVLSIVLMLIGLPSPFVWGAVAAVLNFVLYLGPLAVTVGLFLAGLIAFSGPMALLPPIAFLMLNMLEAQFVTPSLIGRNISVNPLLIFVSLLFWLWLWGPLGGIIAIPVLVIAMVMLDLFETIPDATEG